MGFKVTVHKNGAKHGEMHYSSEAVAVGMANKMKNAGAEASVARCNGTGCGCMNANPRRRTSTRAASDSLFALEATIRQTEAMLPAAAVRAAREESGWSSGVMAMASRSEMESYLRELRRTLKANPRRRNGAKLPAGWKVYLVGKHRVEATKNGVLMAARNVGDGWIGLRGPNYALPPMGVMKEGNTLLTGSPFAANRRRNGADPVAAMDALVEGDAVEITVKPRYADPKTIKGTVIQRSADYLMVSGTRGGKSHFHRTAYKDARWYMDANGSPTVVGVVKANRRRRRNGTTSANLAASRSMTRQFRR